MRRILKISIIAVLALLVAYAFVEPFRLWMQATIGPPLNMIFGGAYSAITSSPFFLSYIAPTLNAFVIGLMCMVPVAWIWHRSIYNKVRGVAVRSAAREMGPHSEVMNEPISQLSQIAPTPIIEVKAETFLPPPPTPAKKEA